jgi:hypothetical protein
MPIARSATPAATTPSATLSELHELNTTGTDGVLVAAHALANASAAPRRRR